jgi:hypothetical protein
VQALCVLHQVRQRIQFEAPHEKGMSNLPQGVQKDNANLLCLIMNANFNAALPLLIY